MTGQNDGIDASAVPFDVGLQPERTALAWRRTCLSLTIGSLVGTRILPHAWGSVGLIIAGVGIIISLAILLLAHRRYRVHHDLLTSGRYRTAGLADGRLPALVAATAAAAGTIGLVLALTFR